MPPDRRESADKPQPDQADVDVPPRIGPVVFGTMGVGWVMVQCPQQYDAQGRGVRAAWRGE